MTINIFLAIFASVLFLIGAIGCIMADSDKEGIGFIGVIFGVCSVIMFVFAFIVPSNYKLQFYHWFIFICPLVYIINLIWTFFTKKYIVPWKKDYYKEYQELRKEFDNLYHNYNKLSVNFQKLDQSYQNKIKDILKKQSIKINKNNSKLYF